MQEENSVFIHNYELKMQMKKKVIWRTELVARLPESLFLGHFLGPFSPPLEEFFPKSTILEKIGDL